MNIAIVLAGGVGKRLGGKMPKQFIEVQGKPIISYTLDNFAKCAQIDGIIVVCVEDWLTHCREIIEEFSPDKVAAVVHGGSDRRESSWLGVSAAVDFIKRECKERPFNMKEHCVLIHDAARPFINDRIICENIKTALNFGACETAVPMSDTVVKTENDVLENMDNVVPRDKLYRVQTPQSFRLDVIYEAHRDYINNNSGSVTDDASLLLLKNKEVKIVRGSSFNVKITTPEDLDGMTELLIYSRVDK